MSGAAIEHEVRVADVVRARPSGGRRSRIRSPGSCMSGAAQKTWSCVEARRAPSAPFKRSETWPPGTPHVSMRGRVWMRRRASRAPGEALDVVREPRLLRIERALWRGADSRGQAQLLRDAEAASAALAFMRSSIRSWSKATTRSHETMRTAKGSSSSGSVRHTLRWAARDAVGERRAELCAEVRVAIARRFPAIVAEVREEAGRRASAARGFAQVRR
jgi:hypothetical protein